MAHGVNMHINWPYSILGFPWVSLEMVLSHLSNWKNSITGIPRNRDMFDYQFSTWWSLTIDKEHWQAILHKTLGSRNVAQDCNDFIEGDRHRCHRNGSARPSSCRKLRLHRQWPGPASSWVAPCHIAPACAEAAWGNGRSTWPALGSLRTKVVKGCQGKIRSSHNGWVQSVQFLEACRIDMSKPFANVEDSKPALNTRAPTATEQQWLTTSDPELTVPPKLRAMPARVLSPQELCKLTEKAWASTSTESASI